jgi:long-chain fatty acid transport protein
MLPAALSFGAGYQLNLQGLRQIAMGGGGTAWPWDASTIFYNPGGLSFLEGMQAYGSVSVVIPRTQFIDASTGISERMSNQTFTPFNLYVGGTLPSVSRLGIGVGVYTPFGTGTRWDDNFSGRFISQEINLQAIFVQPTVSYRITDNISIGAGFIYAFGKVDLRRGIPVQDQSGREGQAQLEGKADGIGYNVGINLKATDALHFGISYRSQVDMDVENGTANFNVPASVQANFPNTSFTSTLPLPEVLSIGVGYKPLERLTMQLDFNLVGWQAYDTLGFNYAQNTASLQDTRAPRLYKNTMAVRLGGNYQATDKLGLMAGTAYDPSPARDNYISPDLPDANRIILSGGFSFKPVEKLTILGAVEYSTSEKRQGTYSEANFSGTYQSKAIIPSIGVTYDF